MDVEQEERPPERGIAGGPRARTNMISARAAAARRTEKIKPILPLKFNLVQPREHQPNKNNAAESTKNETLADDVKSGTPWI